MENTIITLGAIIIMLAVLVFGEALAKFFDWE
jgi:uncharacterized membrane protein